MKTRNTIIAIALFAICFTLLPAAYAVSATNFTPDKSSYNPGDSGKATITFTNDRGTLIQITSVSMTINYFYQDGRIYSQAFTTTGLSMNVTSGAISQPITVQFSLPSTVATGYVTPSIRVNFNILNGGSFQPDHDTSDAPTPLLIASTSAQTSAQTTMYAFVATTVLFAALAFYFAIRYYSAKGTTSRPRTSP